MLPAITALVSWERMDGALQKVKDRLRRTATALGEAGIPYAVVGDSAVAAWVSRVDETGVRNTRDVDILLRRNYLPAARAAMEPAGFHHRRVAMLGTGETMDFLDGPDARVRDALHILWAGDRRNLQSGPDVLTYQL